MIVSFWVFIQFKIDDSRHERIISEIQNESNLSLKRKYFAFMLSIILMIILMIFNIFYKNYNENKKPKKTTEQLFLEAIEKGQNMYEDKTLNDVGEN